jgi:hypothetical protein
MWFIVLLCLGASVALGAPPAVAEAKSKLVSEAQIEDWLKSWQKRLHLEDWRIDARIVRATELKPDTLGNPKWNTLNHTAAIKVLSPLDYETTPAEIIEDMEYTVVHELVHLQLSVLPRDLNKRDVEEVVVNKISDALMSLDKGPMFRARSSPVPNLSRPSEGSNSPEVSRKSGGGN